VQGDRAEAAALELCVRLRELTGAEPFTDTRVTVGIVEPLGATACERYPAVALRCTLVGEANHAGATPTRDRRDPGVALGRLVREFDRWLAEDAPAAGGLQPRVGDVVVQPGTNRNVIPQRACVTVALVGGELTTEQARDLHRTLEGHAGGVLSRSVESAGEGLRHVSITPTSFVNVAEQARVTLDLRDASRATMDAYRDRIDALLGALRDEYAVTVQRDVVQELDPQPVESTGQALLMERSFGGSHNPDENELVMDLTRGCVLQLQVLHEVLRTDVLKSETLAQVVDRHLPQRWKARVRRFVSGAQHDASNFSMRAASDASASSPGRA
jgi:acetylornithine deacetylase/succinyl-diaminopimelate desuccinylase-like protein